ncbi:hypothetical protein [Gelria sp. Kuro-4]|uniref:hypothetical protein n=1 Tax=Gelria sp. Kuro-4 TaxID=2796927 RepID=UPI001BF0690F|nr:hypothetical protein [Gelria sp. Kuro-4]BCV23313.1 hypothetical protein kuro4_00860 [Gelria sp. Kuro-4]
MTRVWCGKLGHIQWYVIHVDTEAHRPVGELPPEQQERIRAAVERFSQRLMEGESSDET